MRGSPKSGVITEAHLTGLPEPIQRYLAYAQVVGKHPIQTVRLTQRGAMALGAGRRWQTEDGRQVYKDAARWFTAFTGPRSGCRRRMVARCTRTLRCTCMTPR
jgi:hypothetical protein